MGGDRYTSGCMSVVVLRKLWLPSQRHKSIGCTHFFFFTSHKDSKGAEAVAQAARGIEVMLECYVQKSVTL